jgi:hypothetical protein
VCACGARCVTKGRGGRKAEEAATKLRAREKKTKISVRVEMHPRQRQDATRGPRAAPGSSTADAATAAAAAAASDGTIDDDVKTKKNVERPDGPELDPSEPFTWALQLIFSAAVFLESKWVDTLKGWLLLALELAGRYEQALEVRRMLEDECKGNRQRLGLVLATGLVAAAVAAIIGIASW